MGDLLLSIYGSYFINRVVDGWAEPPMHAENSVIYNCRKGKIVENIGAVSPHVQRAVLP